jgi:hypothetical protein
MAKDAIFDLCECYQWGRLAERLLYAARAAELAVAPPAPDWGAATNYYQDIWDETIKIPAVFPALRPYAHALAVALKEARVILDQLQNVGVERPSALRREHLVGTLEEKSELVVSRVEHLVANLKALCCYRD